MSTTNHSASRIIRLCLGALLTAALVVTASGTAGAVAPTIAVTPTTGMAGHYVTVSGAGWPGYDGIVVRVGTTYMCSVTSDSTGTVPTQSCIVPTSLTAGAYVVSASDGTNTANAPSFTLAPGLTLFGSGGSATGAAAVGQAVSVTGNGFAASSPVTAKFNGSAVALTPAATTNVNGTFPGSTFTVPNVAAGSYPLLVTAGAGHTATATLEVDAATLVAPASGLSGGAISVSGAGWPGDDSIVVRLYLGASGAYVCTIYTDTTGAIPAQSCIVPTNLPAGSYQINASDGYLSVSHAFTVSPGLVVYGSGGSSSGDVAAGQTVGLTGSGFTPGSAVTAKFNGVAVTLTPSITTNSAGSFTGATFVVPAKTTAGKSTLVVTDGSSISSSLSIAIYKAKLAAPATAASGSLVSFSGSGWPGIDSIVVRLYQGTSGSYVCTIYSIAGGTVPNQGCTVPTGLPAGSYSLVASDGNASVTKPFKMTPGVTMLGSSGSATARAAAGQIVGLTGTGFTPGSAITAKFNGAAVALSPATTANGQGAFTGVIFTVPAVAAGSYPLLVKDASGATVTVSLRVFAATLTTPASGVSGTQVPISGTGWPGNDSIVVRLYQGTSNTYVCSVSTDSTGSIAPQTCAIPTGLPAGTYNIVASDSLISVTRAGFAIHAGIALTNTNSQPAASAAPGATLNLAGSGFTASSIITSAKVGTTAVTLTPASPPTSTNGSFSGVTFVVPAIAAGTYVVTVKDASANVATVQLIVT